MVPTLIVLGLLVLGVVIVAYATRRRPKEGEQLPTEADTAWNDEFTPAGKPPVAADPFSHVPPATAEPVRPSVTPVERI
jgi:hypothetical protein